MRVLRKSGEYCEVNRYGKKLSECVLKPCVEKSAAASGTKVCGPRSPLSPKKTSTEALGEHFDDVEQ